MIYMYLGVYIAYVIRMCTYCIYTNYAFYMCVCIVYMYVCIVYIMCICVYTYCIYTNCISYVCIYVCVYCIYYMCICMYAYCICTQLYIFVCLYICTCVCIYTHTLYGFCLSGEPSLIRTLMTIEYLLFAAREPKACLSGSPLSVTSPRREGDAAPTS